jgi:DNA-directed RNA polymerase subunit K/omega
MTHYEFVRIIGLRTQQISEGAPSTIIKADARDASDLALAELLGGVCPLLIDRPLPNGTIETVDSNKLIITPHVLNSIVA